MAKAKARSRTFKSLEECLAAAGRLEEEPDATTRSACTPDFELFLPLGLPRKGDWLAEHKETGQSFSTYHRRMKYPATPGKHTDTILLVPFGSFAEGVAQQFRPLLLDYCQAFFSGMMVECLPKPLSLSKARRRQNDFGHDQYLIEDLFDALHKETSSHHRAYCRLGFTLEDIYPGDGWNYVFGQARPMERVGVFSFARHSPFFYEGLHASEVPSLKDGAGWLRECMRTMVHETCHMFGMLHCVYFHCLMNGSNGPQDTAGRFSFLCPVCLRKLLLALSYAPGDSSVLPRYQAIQRSMQNLLEEFRAQGVPDGEMEGLLSDLQWLEMLGEWKAMRWQGSV
ncbi:unnamed protein product [Durusdinium trenchii]|uniref:Archaemetzincin-2 n=1 Tax=Durusdinium trenchii TaxID=1381693 RepID=A0ABP0JTR7_9DINO